MIRKIYLIITIWSIKNYLKVIFVYICHCMYVYVCLRACEFVHVSMCVYVCAFWYFCSRCVKNWLNYRKSVKYNRFCNCICVILCFPFFVCFIFVLFIKCGYCCMRCCVSASFLWVSLVVILQLCIEVNNSMRKFPCGFMCICINSYMVLFVLFCVL